MRTENKRMKKTQEIEKKKNRRQTAMKYPTVLLFPKYLIALHTKYQLNEMKCIYCYRIYHRGA